jgi:poly-beta-1,6-N-acetyl-D-glucosamine biosynthesis protein PgaD
MEKPGPRSPHLKIIDEPALKSPLRHLLEGSITLCFWALWIYWLLPVLTALLWVFGIHLFYREIFPQGGMEELLGLLRGAGLVFLSILATIVLWTRYNYLWFLKRGERRNKLVAICHDEDLAKFFRANPEEIRNARREPVLEVELGEEGVRLWPRPEKVRPLREETGVS